MNKKLVILSGAALAALGAAAVAQDGAAPTPPHRDRNSDETRQQVIDSVQQRFQRLDLDHDGRFTPDEARQAREQMRQHMQDRMFDRLDLNHDGSITRDEMNQARAQMRQHMQERIAQRRQQAGGDQAGGSGGPGMHRGIGRGGWGMNRGRDMFGAQGYITLDQMRDQALQRFDRLDLNHDGTVTAAERQQARDQLRQRMEQRRQQFRERMEQRRQGQGQDGAAPSQPQ